MPDYGENFCKAIDIILDERQKQLKFDITDIYTIVDDSEAYNGIYRVSNGVEKFNAYSDLTTYTKDQEVYVVIPKGDYSQQKTIIGLKNDSDKNRKRKDLYNQMIVDNDNSYKISGNFGLAANGEKKTTNIGTKSGLNISKNNRLGIKANFISQLKDFNVIYGNYGVEVQITYRKNGRENNLITTFDSSEFFGDPYNFSGYVSQEKVFNISDLEIITKVSLELYQKNNFINKHNERIQASETTNNIKIKDIELNFGIGIDDIENEYIHISTSGAMNYSSKDKNLTRNIELTWIHKTEDKRTVVVSPKTISKLDKETKKFYEHCKITWYRYRPGNTINDDSDGGLYWIPQDKYIYNIQDEKYYQINQSTTNFSIIYTIEENPMPTEHADFAFAGCKMTGDKWKRIDKETDLTFPIFNYEFNLDLSKPDERIKVMIFHYNEDGKVDRKFESNNILLFENDNMAQGDTTIQSLTALDLRCSDNSKGNYYIYNLANELSNSNSNNNKQLVCYFGVQGEEVKSEIENVTLIEWYIPIKNTMLDFDLVYSRKWYSSEEEAKKDNTTSTTIGLLQKDKETVKFYDLTISENEYTFTEKTNIPFDLNAKKSNDNFVCLFRKFGKDNIKSQFSLNYNIKSTLNEGYDNNYISCKIKKDGIEYSKTQYFNFGHKGTHSSGKGLILSIANNVKSIVYDSEWVEVLHENFQTTTDSGYETMKVMAQLYDSNGQEVKADNIQYDFSWYEPSLDTPYLHKNSNGSVHKKYQKGLSLYSDGSLCTIGLTQRPEEAGFISEAAFLNTMNILKCEASLESSSEKLIAFLAIPKCNKAAKEADWDHITGTDKIIFDSSLTPQFVNEEYRAYTSDNTLLENLHWQIIDEANKIETKDKSGQLYVKKGDEKTGFYYIPVLNQNLNDNTTYYKLKTDYNYPIINIPNAWKLINKESYTLNEKTTYKIKQKIVNKDEETGEEKITEKTIILSGEELKEINKEEINQIEEAIPYSERKWLISENDLFFNQSPIFGILSFTNKKMDNNEIDIDYTKPVWIQPIISIVNNKFSAIINEWNGQTLGINEGEGYLLGKMLAAGSKNENNEFSGVIMGNWKGTDSQKAITEKVGLYGFNNGLMSFSFTEDGKATIGKANKGQLRFDGNEGTIQSGNYEFQNKGMKIDYSKGIVEIAGTNGKIVLDGSDDNDGQGITDYPFELGNNFKVTWDGTVIAKDGIFEGTINAKKGILGNLNLIGSLQVPYGKGGSLSWMETIYDGNLITNEEELYAEENEERIYLYIYRSNEGVEKILNTVELFETYWNKMHNPNNSDKGKIYKKEKYFIDDNETIGLYDAIKFMREVTNTDGELTSLTGATFGTFTKESWSPGDVETTTPNKKIFLGLQTNIVDGGIGFGNNKLSIGFDCSNTGDFKAIGKDYAVLGITKSTGTFAVPDVSVSIQKVGEERQIILDADAVYIKGNAKDPTKQEGIYARFAPETTEKKEEN